MNTHNLGFCAEIIKISVLWLKTVPYLKTVHIYCGYSLEASWQGASNENPLYMFHGEIRKISVLFC